MLSVIIPSYKNPKYLDMCLKSIIENQSEKNEIIVVIDGFIEVSTVVMGKYKNDVSFLEFETNYGMPRAINYGVYNATNDWVLIASEDNVFCKDWDKILKYTIENNLCDNRVLTINQIEPYRGIYKMNNENFGLYIEDFDYQKFLEDEPSFRKNEITEDGSTFPFMLRKSDFMKVGGLDIDYPSPFVVDWDFFLKCELAGMELGRLHKLNFYHFVSKSTKNREGYIENQNEQNAFFISEQQAAQYFEYKWGFSPKRDENNKCKQYVKF